MKCLEISNPFAFVEQTTQSITNTTEDNSTQAVTTTTTTTESTTTTPEQKIFYIVVDPTTIQVEIYDNAVCEYNFNMTPIHYTRILSKLHQVVLSFESKSRMYLI